ncbi:MAG: hypothetical protein AAFY02_05965 [Pseudomonadota bacterium]
MAAAPASSGKKRPSFLWILLALSLALNVSLIVGALIGSDEDAPLRGNALITQLGERLSLSDAQQMELLSIRNSVVDRFRAHETQGKDWGAMLASVLKEPNFNGGDLKLGLVERDTGRIDFFISIISRLYDFTHGLQPAAREAFLQELETDNSFLRRLFSPDPQVQTAQSG